MYYHLGPVGDLRALPPIERDQDVEDTAEGPAAEYTSIEGQRTLDRLGPLRRTWTLPWLYLGADEADLIASLRRGDLGGPLWLVDPNRPNLAPPQVARAGCELRSARGWYVDTGVVRWRRLPAPPAAEASRTAVRSAGAIEWTRPTAASVLSTGLATVAQRTPLLPDTAVVTCVSLVRLTSTTPVSIRPGWHHWNADGAGLITRPTAQTPLPPGQWVELIHQLVVPAGRVTASPAWEITAGQPASVVEVAAVAYGYGPLAPPFSAGGGAARVIARALSESHPSEGETNLSLELVEA